MDADSSIVDGTTSVTTATGDKHEIIRGDNDRRRIRRKYTDPSTGLATANPKAPATAPSNNQGK